MKVAIQVTKGAEFMQIEVEHLRLKVLRYLGADGSSRMIQHDVLDSI